MQRVGAVPAAVLLHLDAFTIVDLVFHRDVVAPLALLTRQRHLNALFVFSHLSISFLRFEFVKAETFKMERGVCGAAVLRRSEQMPRSISTFT